jgi:hypothetical protein
VDKEHILHLSRPCLHKVIFAGYPLPEDLVPYETVLLNREHVPEKIYIVMA